MEMMFKECPHPDDKQRQHLSRELGLEPRQVIEELQREINSIQVERTGAHGESRNPCMSREVERHKAGSVLSS
jgi:homeobox-leucine zipper protein